MSKKPMLKNDPDLKHVYISNDYTFLQRKEHQEQKQLAGQTNMNKTKEASDTASDTNSYANDISARDSMVTSRKKRKPTTAPQRSSLPSTPTQMN
jgi:hypothetical protein